MSIRSTFGFVLNGRVSRSACTPGLRTGSPVFHAIAVQPARTDAEIILPGYPDADAGRCDLLTGFVAVGDEPADHCGIPEANRVEDVCAPATPRLSNIVPDVHASEKRGTNRLDWTRRIVHRAFRHRVAANKKTRNDLGTQSNHAISGVDAYLLRRPRQQS